MGKSRLILVGAGLLAVVALFLVLRPDDGDEAAATTAAPAETVVPPDTTSATGAAATEPPAAPTTSEDAGPASLAVSIRAGTVSGGIQRWTVARGERVRIVVRSDVEDSVHLHGYDIEKAVAPGAPAIFVFDARLPGRFELEAHHGGGQIAQLDVEP